MAMYVEPVEMSAAFAIAAKNSIKMCQLSFIIPGTTVWHLREPVTKRAIGKLMSISVMSWLNLEEVSHLR